jgi:hypothetical protein
VLILSVLALGFLHGLGADHLMAIAALSVTAPAIGPVRYGRAFWLALRFATGHALLLALGTAAVLLLGWQLPLWLEQAGEVAGGCLLIVLGVIGGWLAVTGRVYAHSHAHAHVHGSHDAHDPHDLHDLHHRHWHIHVGRRHEHRARSIHTALPGVLGAVFAVSGLRALVLALPLWGAPQEIGNVISLVAVFAVGILASMSLFGIVLAHTLDPRRMSFYTARLAAGATALGSLALGIYWIQ